jgi:hypothetical protein
MSAHISGVQAFLLTGLAVTVIARVTLLAAYLDQFWLRHGSQRRIIALKRAVRVASSGAYPGTPAERGERHRRFFDASVQQWDSALLVGSVALAAWTQLFATFGERPAPPVSAFSQNMLLLSAITLVVVPGLFRSSGGEWTRLGRDAGMLVGFAMLIVALAGILDDLFGTWGSVAAVAVVAASSAREIAQVYQEIRLQNYLLTDPHVDQQ